MFLKTDRQKRQTEKGNIFFMLFAAVSVVGALGVGSVSLLKGPVSNMVKTNQQVVIEGRADLGLRIMINNVISNSSICDTDDTIEAMEWRDTSAGLGPAPIGGGFLPDTIGSKTADPWGRQLGYCSWDHGALINSGGCAGGKRRAGSSDTNWRDQEFITVISAGPDQVFQTSCVDYVDTTPDDDVADTPLVARVTNSDDIVFSYDYEEMRAIMGDNFTFKVGTGMDGDAVTTGQGLELSQDVTVTGVLDFDKIDGGVLTLPDISGTTCNGTTDEQMFRDMSTNPPTIMYCDGSSFVQIGGAGGGGGVSPNFDPDKANCVANAGGPLVLEDTYSGAGRRTIRGFSDGNYTYTLSDTNNGTAALSFDGSTISYLADIVSPTNDPEHYWSDGTYIYAGEQAGTSGFLRAYTFDGTSFTEVGSVDSRAVQALWGDDEYIYAFTAFNEFKVYTFDGSDFVEVYLEDLGSVSITAIWNDEDYLYLLSTSRLYVYTFDGENLTRIADLSGSGGQGVWGDGEYLYVASGGTSGLKAYFFDGAQLTFKGSVTTSRFEDVWSDGVHVYAASDISPRGLYVYDFDGTNFSLVDSITTNDIGRIWSDGTYIYGSHSSDEIDVYSGFECTEAIPIPQKVDLPDIDAENNNTNQIYGWGLNSFPGDNNLGDPTYTGVDQPSPVLLGTLSGFSKLSGGDHHTCGIRTDGTAWCWGRAGVELGVGITSGTFDVPAKVLNIENVIDISTHDRHSCAVLSNGEAWCWGSNSRGELGAGLTGSVYDEPQKVLNIENFVSIVAGGTHSCGLTDVGEMWCWGYDAIGQLGNGESTQTEFNYPVKVKNLSNIVTFDSAGSHNCAVTEGGEVWCWGSDSAGRLGNGPTVTGNQHEPTKVVDLTDVVQVSMGESSSCALKSNGEAWCWGHNSDGGLGNGTTTFSTVPTQVINIDDFVKLSSGEGSSCGLRANGEIWCWGADGDEQLGNGATSGDQTAPVKIDSTLKFSDIHDGLDTFFATHVPLEDGDESTPIAPYVIRQGGNAGPGNFSHGLVIQRNSTTAGQSAGVGFAVDEQDTASGDDVAVRIESTIDASGDYSLDFLTESSNLMRINKDGNLGVGLPLAGGNQFGRLQINGHPGIWNSDEYHDGLLITSDTVATLNPAYYGTHKDTGDTVILSGKELLIQHSDTQSATITPVATFLNASGSKFFGDITVEKSNKSLSLNAYTDTATEYAAYNFFRYRGTEAAPLAVSNASGDDSIGTIAFRGHDGNDMDAGATINAQVDGVVSPGDVPVELLMGVHPDDSGISNTYRLRIRGGTGYVGFNESSPRSVLHIGGRAAAEKGIKIGNDPNCASSVNDPGTLRYTGTAWEYCDGTNWLPLISDADNYVCNDTAVFYDIDGGQDYTCGTLSNGQVMCWGRNESGWLGNGITTNPMPDRIPISRYDIYNAIKVSAGRGHSCALLDNGQIKCWGDGSNGELGIGTTLDVAFPERIAASEKFIDVDAGVSAGHACAVTEGGRVMCWGRNTTGQLGYGKGSNASHPVYVHAIDNAVKVSVGHNHSCALLSDKTAKCWGDNDAGELGKGSTSVDEVYPVEVTGLTDLIDVDIGGDDAPEDTYAACGVKTNGQVWCWGDNSKGQMGQGTTGSTDQLTPIQVSGISNAVDVEIGGETVCVLRSDGTVSCWGSDSNGRLGNGAPSADSSTPVDVSGISTAVKIGVGRRHACAVLQNGSAECWGFGAQGQLGDGFTSSSDSPVNVINPYSCSSDKYVFVTSTTYDGNLGGIDGADAICQRHAEKGRLPGIYKAWISDRTDSPLTRFEKLSDTHDYILTTGTHIDDGWDDLSDNSSISAPIDRDEYGNSVVGQNVWTNTDKNGTIESGTDDCVEWTSNDSGGFITGRSGSTSQINGSWTDGSSPNCNNLHHLYCFQQ